MQVSGYLGKVTLEEAHPFIWQSGLLGHDAKSRILYSGFQHTASIQDLGPGSWTQDPGSRIQVPDAGSGISWIQDP